MRNHAILAGGRAIVNIYHTSTQIFVTAVSEDIIKFVVLTLIIKTEHMSKEDRLMVVYDTPNIEVIEVEVEQVLASSMQYEDWD